MTDAGVYTQHQDIPVETAPDSVVSLVPSVTESLFDLNLGNCLVARTDYCIYPQGQVESIPSVGGTKTPDINKIIALKPELIIANKEENRKQDIEALQAAGLPVWVTFPKTVPDVFNFLWNVMYLFDETSMVPRIRLIEYSYDWVMGVTKANEDNPVRVFAPIWWEPLMTFNADTYIHDVFSVCGGTNVFAQREHRYPLKAELGQIESYPVVDPRVVGLDERYPRITMEEVEASQPDVIFLPDEPYHFDETHVEIFAALDVPAAKNERIHVVDGTLLTWHGTRIAYALDTLPALIYPMDVS